MKKDDTEDIRSELINNISKLDDLQSGLLFSELDSESLSPGKTASNI